VVDAVPQLESLLDEAQGGAYQNLEAMGKIVGFNRIGKVR
jgi:hypothetical protein